ncbi:DUF6907 domain-containing protein [Streptomyces sp. NPDC102365]|uniref:DUF6907 domain-containing protein n=1 Tax=Streptomyces sp. NPDC102365 TaxID=3366162 RepID=UPI00380EA893
MSTEPRTITLPTIDAGEVTLSEPSWCTGHAHHDPESARVDLMHAALTVDLVHLGEMLLSAQIVQSPCATPGGPALLGGRVPGVSVAPLGRTLNPAELYRLAAAVDAYAEQLRDLAGDLDTILSGGAL